MKTLLSILFLTVIACAGTQGRVDEIKWLNAKAIKDSTETTIITPGIIIATGDTSLFKFEQYSQDYRLQAVVWNKAQLCDWFNDEIKMTDEQLRTIDEELAFLNQRKAEVEARKGVLKDWRRKLKNKFNINCKEVTQ